MFRILGYLFEKADRISPDRLALSFSILLDKVKLLQGQPTVIHENRSMKINGQEVRYREFEAMLIDAQLDPSGDEGTESAAS